jgi:hypothetical protein
MPSLKKKLSGPCPTFFRALCRTASDGTTGGYQWAGYGLAGHLSGSQLMPDDVTDDEWQERIQALSDMIGREDEAGSLAWLVANEPRCMALVPRARRGAFFRGIYRYVVEEEKGLF